MNWYLEYLSRTKGLLGNIHKSYVKYFAMQSIQRRMLIFIGKEMPREANRIIVMRELELQRAKCEQREKNKLLSGMRWSRHQEGIKPIISGDNRAKLHFKDSESILWTTSLLLKWLYISWFCLSSHLAQCPFIVWLNDSMETSHPLAYVHINYMSHMYLMVGLWPSKSEILGRPVMWPESLNIRK